MPFTLNPVSLIPLSHVAFRKRVATQSVAVIIVTTVVIHRKKDVISFTLSSRNFLVTPFS